MLQKFFSKEISPLQNGVHIINHFVPGRDISCRIHEFDGNWQRRTSKFCHPISDTCFFYWSHWTIYTQKLALDLADIIDIL